MSEDSRLKKAWRQLELENPDSTERLNRLMVKEQQKHLMKQTQKKMKEHDKKENQKEKEQIHAKREGQKQKESYHNSHLRGLLQQLWLPNFMRSFGDVKLVFMGGESIRFYRSILANISLNWKTIMEVCMETDTVLLPETEIGEFWDETKNYLFCKEKTKQQLLSEGRNERKFKDEDSLAVEPFLESDREPEKTDINYDNTNKPTIYMNTDKNRQKSAIFRAASPRICEVCLKIIRCRSLPRHMWESHKIGDAVNFQHPCKTVWNCGKTFTRAQAEASHECRANPSIFSSTCHFCLDKYKSEKALKNHRKNGTCQTNLQKLDKWIE